MKDLLPSERIPCSEKWATGGSGLNHDAANAKINNAIRQMEQRQGVHLVLPDIPKFFAINQSD